MLNLTFPARRFSHENLRGFCCPSLSFWQLKKLDYHCLRYWTVQTTMEKCVCIWQSKVDIQRFVFWLIAFRQTVLVSFKFFWHCSFLWKARLGFGGRGGETRCRESTQSHWRVTWKMLYPGVIVKCVCCRHYFSASTQRCIFREITIGDFLMPIPTSSSLISLISNSSRCFSRSWNFAWIQGLTWARRRWQENSQWKLCKWSIKEYMN